MFEPTAQARTRDALRAAHAERGAMIADLAGRLFRKPSR